MARRGLGPALGECLTHATQVGDCKLQQLAGEEVESRKARLRQLGMAPASRRSER